MSAARQLVRSAPRFTAQLRAPAQRRMASSATENEFIKERQHIKDHAKGTTAPSFPPWLLLVPMPTGFGTSIGTTGATCPLWRSDLSIPTRTSEPRTTSGEMVTRLFSGTSPSTTTTRTRLLKWDLSIKDRMLDN